MIGRIGRSECILLSGYLYEKREMRVCVLYIEWIVFVSLDRVIFL